MTARIIVLLSYALCLAAHAFVNLGPYPNTDISSGISQTQELLKNLGFLGFCLAFNFHVSRVTLAYVFLEFLVI